MEWELFMSESKPANAAASAAVWDNFQASPPVWTISHSVDVKWMSIETMLKKQLNYVI